MSFLFRKKRRTNKEKRIKTRDTKKVRTKTNTNKNTRTAGADTSPHVVTLHPPLSGDDIRQTPTKPDKDFFFWFFAILFFYIYLPVLLFRKTEGKYNLLTRTALSVLLGFVLLSFMLAMGESDPDTTDTVEQTTTTIAALAEGDDFDDNPTLDSATPTPTIAPTEIPTSEPTTEPTIAPTATPTVAPTAVPTTVPTIAPTSAPTITPTQIPTLAPTVSPTESPTAVPVVEAAIESAPTQTTERLVWIPTKGGTKYHSNSSCSGMDGPLQVTISEAIALGFTPCARCY